MHGGKNLNLTILGLQVQRTYTTKKRKLMVSLYESINEFILECLRIYSVLFSSILPHVIPVTFLLLTDTQYCFKTWHPFQTAVFGRLSHCSSFLHASSLKKGRDNIQNKHFQYLFSSCFSFCNKGTWVGCCIAWKRVC